MSALGYSESRAENPAHVLADFLEHRINRLGEVVGPVGAVGDPLQQGEPYLAFVKLSQAPFGDGFGLQTPFALPVDEAAEPVDLRFVVVVERDRTSERKRFMLHRDHRSARRQTGWLSSMHERCSISTTSPKWSAAPSIKPWASRHIWRGD